MSFFTARPSSTNFQVDNPFFLNIMDNPNWQRQFGNNHPIKLEIGFGMGEFLVAIAKQEPHYNFVGIDFSHVAIKKLLDRIETFKLKNIRIVFGDIRQKLPTLFKDEELDSIYINLPDPWPKKRHSKRRLINPELVKQISKKLASSGKVYLATDSKNYADEILEYFNADSLLKNINGEMGVLNQRSHLPKTKYEKSFLYAKDKIYYLDFVKTVGELPFKIQENNETIHPSGLSNDEYLTFKFKKAEANAKDACDLKLLADQLAEAGDLEWARSIYLKAQVKAEDSLDLNWLGYSVVLVLKDNDWAIKIFQEAELKAENSLDLNWLAYSIFESLGNKGWAKDLFKKAETQNENIRDMCDLAESVLEILNDEKWQFNIYKKAAANAKEYSDFYELADNVFTKLADKKWACKLYNKAEEKAEDCCDLIGLAECFIEKLGKREEASRIYKKAETQAEDNLDFSCLAESIAENMGDKEWVDKVFKKAQLSFK